MSFYINQKSQNQAKRGFLVNTGNKDIKDGTNSITKTKIKGRRDSTFKKTKKEANSITKGLSRRLSTMMKTLEMLESSSRNNKASPSRPTTSSKHLRLLKCEELPGISIANFVERIRYMGEISDDVFTVAFIFMKRAMKRADFSSPLYIHKLLAVAVFVAYNYLIDTEVWYLEEFSKLIGVETTELLRMQIVLVVDILEFRLFVSAGEFYRSKMALEGYSRLN